MSHPVFSEALFNARARTLAMATGVLLSLYGLWALLGHTWVAAFEPEGLAPNGWRPFIFPDAAVIGGLMLCGAAMAGDHPRPWKVPFGIYAGAAAGFVIVANGYFLGVTDSTIWPWPDSASYVSYNACRVPGYFLFLWPFMGLAPHWLIATQLNLLVLAKVAISAAVYRVTGSAAAGALALLLGMIIDPTLAFSFNVLTEAPFDAALGFAAATALAYVASPRPHYAAAAGLSVAAATAVKAVAPVLILAIAPLLLRPAARRGLNATLLIGIPVAALLALTLSGRLLNGAWSPTNFSGYALVGHVAWGIKSDALSSDRELSKSLEDNLRPVISAWPPITDLPSYVRRTSDDLNPMLSSIIIPTVVKRLEAKSPTQSPDSGAKLICTRQLNSALMNLSEEAVRRYPARYAAHVLAHFEELWVLAFEPIRWQQLAVEIKSTYEPFNWVRATLPVPWQASPATLRQIEAGLVDYDRIHLAIDHVIPVPSRPWHVIFLALGLIAVALTFFSIQIARLSREMAALAMLSSIINADFLGQAMFQPAIPRYAAAVEIPLTGFLAIALFVTANAVFRLLRRALGYQHGPAPAAVPPVS